MKIYDSHSDILDNLYTRLNEGVQDPFKEYHLDDLEKGNIVGGIWVVYSSCDFDMMDAYPKALKAFEPYKEKYDETTGNDIGTTDGIGKEDKTGNIETGRTEQFQDVHPLQEREQKQVGEITDTIPDKEKLTDENIFLLIQQGYEIDTIMKDWRNLIS
jgi:hypothetical protein